MRVHAFLEQWGLINYQVSRASDPKSRSMPQLELSDSQIDPETKPAALGPPFTGHFRVTLDTPRGLQPLHPGTKPNPQPDRPALSSSSAAPRPPPHPTNLDLRKTIYNTSAHDTIPITAQDAQKAINDSASASAGPSVKKAYACEVCGVDCTRARYHSLKDGKYIICVACYSSGRFSSTMHSGGFVRMDDEAFKHATSADGGDWSDQETLLLLEGIEMFDEDWLKVAEHVGTRSKEQCVMHFLQLPIEDEYLDESGAELGPLRFASKSLDGSGSAGLPFSKADNPVMSVVAFLASAVGPGVAAAAAQRALGELTDGLKAGIKASADRSAEVDAEVAAKEKESQEKKDEEGKNGMQVDDSTVVEAEDAEKEAGSTSEAKVEKDDVEMDKEDAVRETEAPANETADIAAASSGLPHSHVQHVATLALGAAAVKASALAVHEERQLESLVTRLVAAQMKKLELKLGMFEKFEEMLEQEKRQLEIQKQQFFKDKLNLQSQLANAQELLNKARAGQNSAQVAGDVAKAVQASAPQSTAGGVRPVPMEGIEVPTDGSIQPLT